jgi:hypothetical protein
MRKNPKRLILSQPWGGLGDNLQFSTLPELCHRKGMEFYLSSENAYRNPEIYDLVWGKNPYVSGILAEKPNAGSCIPYRNSCDNIISNMEMAHGFVPEGKYPKVYYVPKRMEEFKGRIVVDLGTTSHSYDESHITDMIMRRFKIGDLLLLKPRIKVSEFSYSLNCQPYEYRDIYEYCDIISSCSLLICFFSGSAVLSAALNRNTGVQTVCFVKDHVYKQSIHNGLYIFDNIEYVPI